MRRRVVGTAGHIDHGKTTLVRALTGAVGDRLPEEKRRGITIDLGFASLITPEVQIGFVDVPGHERFVKNMLAGIGGIDSVLLVVAGDESIKPQTREHFSICRLLGIRSGVIALTKSDLADADLLELVRLEIDQLVEGSFLEGQPVIPVSARTRDGIDLLREAIVASVLSTEEREVSTRVFRLPIDRAFSMKGFGSVVTGTTVSGSLSHGSPIEILPDRTITRARGLEVHGESRETVSAGERTSINLADIGLDQLHRGQVLSTPGAMNPSQVLTAELEILPDSAPLEDDTRVRVHLYSAEILGTVRLVGSKRVEVLPGQKAYVQLRLESEVAAVRGDRFVVRRYSPALTIGGGVILDAHLGKLSRGTRDEIFETLATGSFGERMTLLAKLAGARGVSLRDLQTRTGIREEALRQQVRKEKIPQLVEVGDSEHPRWLHSDLIRDLRRKAIGLLENYFARNPMRVGLSKSEFFQKLLPPRTDESIARFLLKDLVAEKIVAANGDLLDLPSRGGALSGMEGDLARTIEARFREVGLQPPPISELIQTISQKPKVIEGIVAYLAKTGVLVRIAEGVFLHRDTIAAARERIEKHSGESVDIAWFKEFFSLSRKIAIPLLEFFDRSGVTKRLGDRRQIL